MTEHPNYGTQQLLSYTVPRSHHKQLLDPYSDQSISPIEPKKQINFGSGLEHEPMDARRSSSEKRMSVPNAILRPSCEPAMIDQSNLIVNVEGGPLMFD
jgi:hypothetical protein